MKLNLLKCFPKPGLIIVLLISLFVHEGYAAELPQLSSRSIVSIIQCSPSSSSESAFGHSAIRIQDDSLRIDVIFNFGTYDHDRPLLFYKLLLGKMESSLEGEAFYEFAKKYHDEGRGIREFYLDLVPVERQRIWIDLNKRLLSNNRFYSFNMTENNCTTHVRDVLFEQLKLNESFYKGLSSGYTVRDAEHQSPVQNCWLHLLFNLAVGAGADDVRSAFQLAFYPDGLIMLLKAVNENERILVVAEHELFPPTQVKELPNRIATVLLFSILLFLSAYLVYIQYKRKKSFVWFDRVLFLVSGLVGLFLLSLMVFSEISELRINYNILWALPTNIALAFLIKKRNTNRWGVYLARIALGSIVCFLFFSFFFRQYIPAEAYLFAVALLVRSYVYALSLK